MYVFLNYVSLCGFGQEHGDTQGSERAMDRMDLELEEGVNLLIGLLGTELFLCKSSTYSQPPSHLSSPILKDAAINSRETCCLLSIFCIFFVFFETVLNFIVLADLELTI